MAISKKEAKEIKESILHFMTEDTKHNHAIFDKQDGLACFNGTDLDMVMDKVVAGIWARIDGNV